MEELMLKTPYKSKLTGLMMGSKELRDWMARTAYSRLSRLDVRYMLPPLSTKTSFGS
jgi:hypothetical protein